jgi:redox-sensitive bicupin YhaK (pirin superfamily)
MTVSTITLRPSAERGFVNHGWLQSHHSFSFGAYYDPAHMGFRALRVINDDLIQGGHGFPTHPHRDMEILSVVARGALEHRDSLGNGSVIRPGEVQRMTAGTGIQHSEFNPLPSETTRLIQIWIEPERRGLEPGYQQKSIPVDTDPNRWFLLASRDGSDGSVVIHQDVRVLRSALHRGETATYTASTDRHLWLQMISGAAELNGTRLSKGDGAALSATDRIALKGVAESSDILLFDLA